MRFPSRSSLHDAMRRAGGTVGVAVLALVAFVPALMSSPGRLPADTKLYLYLDPGGLLGRAASTFEADQFAGWVPHQQITYLWPSGPWYWLLDAAGVADWVAHRLWIATIMLAAGLGVRWTARLLGLGVGGALVAALVYQLSPFLLPYISRTSLLLLPWAGLGWIVALTIRATRVPGHASPLQRWRDPALIALVVATVGSGNATALAMIVPAPVLWLLHAHRADRATRRHLVAVAAATTGLCLSVSAWWVAMLTVQSRLGAPVLDYSETLADVSRNATGSEALRGLGYWLFYVRDPVAPTTTASLDYLISSRVIVVSYAVVLVSLAGLVAVRWSHRRFAASLVAVGMVLAVGVHPIGSSSPLMSLLSGDGTSGLALALRSSTRAMPVMLMGLALGAGSLVHAMPAEVRRRRLSALSPRRVATVAAGVLAVANLPALWNLALVDEAIDRDSEPPAAWLQGAAALDERADGFRTLQLPGAEFGAYRWGYTVDQPLVALTDRPVVTRDLLPLGSTAAMDLLYSFDDRWQEGTNEAAAVAPVARLFGADTLWLANDIAFERFRGPRPELVDRFIEDITARDGVGLVQRFGEPQSNVAEVAMLDPTALSSDVVGRPVAPVAIAEVIDAQPVIRAKTDVVVLSGSGDGIVDAASARMLTGDELIRYSATLDPAVISDAVRDRGDGRGAAARLIVTDSNRDRARHWRGSQDVVGFTEAGGPETGVSTVTAADRRLDLFDTADPTTQTVAIQDGVVTARVSGYGEPFAYRPEDRAVMAIDGDVSTAWRVGDHGDPVGESIDVTLTSTAVPLAAVTLRQPAPATGGRVITRIAVAVDGGERSTVELDDRSLQSGQSIEVEPMASGSTLTITIEAVSEGDPIVAASRAGVGFSEIDLGVGPTVELVRPPVDGIDAVGATPFDLVLTRLRVDPSDPWRTDPEPKLQRLVPLTAPATFDGTVTMRLDRLATDERLDELFGTRSAVASGRLRGSVQHLGASAVDGDLDTSWITPFDGAVGASLTIPDAVWDRDATITQPVGSFSPITSIILERNATSIEVAVPTPDASGTSRLELPASYAAEAASTTITIASIDAQTTVDRRYGDVVTLPAAIADLSVAAADRGGSTTVQSDCETTYLEIDGVGVPVSFRTTVDALLGGTAVDATICEPLTLGPGTHRIMSTGGASTGLHVDRLVLSHADRDDPVTAQPPTVTVERSERRERQVRLSACPRGCWLVVGEGYNTAWSAEIDAGDLGPPELVDGGFNGWWIAPTDLPTTVSIAWTAQAPVTLGLLWSGAALLLAVLLVLGAAASRDHSRRDGERPVFGAPTLTLPWGPARGLRTRPALATGVLLVLAAGLLISPEWAAAAAPIGLVSVVVARWQVRVLEVVGLLSAAVVAGSVVWVERRDAPIPNAGWTVPFEHLNGLALFAVLAIAVGSFLERDA